MLGEVAEFPSALYGDHKGPSGIKFWQLYLGPFSREKNSEILKKIDDFSRYVEVAKLKKVVDMRAHAPRKCSKVQPRMLNGESVMAKKLEIPFIPVVNRESLKTESVSVY